MEIQENNNRCIQMQNLCNLRKLEPSFIKDCGFPVRLHLFSKKSYLWRDDQSSPVPFMSWPLALRKNHE